MNSNPVLGGVDDCSKLEYLHTLLKEMEDGNNVDCSRMVPQALYYVQEMLIKQMRRKSRLNMG
jgi:hypothetical protein